MSKKVLAARGLIGLGIVFLVLLVFNFGSDSISKLFADEKNNIGASKAPVVLSSGAKALNDAFIAASNAVNPTVVSISVEIEQKAPHSQFRDEFREFFRFFGEPFGDDDSPRRSESSGSGVIVTSDGYIVTNNHVVENASKDGITVTLFDKKIFKKARLIGTDPLTDLALIKIEAEGLTPAHFANIEDVKIGEFVIAVGNPLGLNSTITSGIISAIGRGQLNLLNRDKYAVENFIQTDAAINPGNSGGGLFNLEGSLVGINSAIATRTGTYIGYGFAIPVDLVRSVIEDLIEDGEIDRGYIGVSIKTLDATEAKAVGLDKVRGVLVSDVLKDSPAEKAGIERGDVILKLDDKPLNSSNELQSLVALRRAGDKVKLTIWRDGKELIKTVTLKPRDEDKTTASADTKGESDEKNKPGEPIRFKELGFAVEPLTDDIKKDYDVENGVVITNVERYSVASDRGLFPNGVITKVDKQTVKSPEQLSDIIRSKKPGEAILLQVKYKDNTQIVAIEIPDS
jgi:serine protease Do